MYSETLALSNNPFNPYFPDIAQPELTNLGGRPLPMDLVGRFPELEKLFCRHLKTLIANETRVREALFGVKSTPGQPCTVNQSLIVLIHGNKGAGKTTFANYLRQMVLAAATRNGAAWLPIRESIPYSGPLTLAVLQSNMLAMEQEVKSKAGGSGGNVLALLDNIPRRSFEEVEAFHRRLGTHFVVFLVTTEESPTDTEDLQWYGYESRVVPVFIPNLAGEELVQYVESRITQFRDPKREEIDKVSRLFPFAESYVRDRLASQPWRVINRWLATDIDSRHKALRDGRGPDVRVCSEEQLAKVMIV